MSAARVILYTGKGGVGKTSVAAATARRCAAAGQSTLVISTDPAHSLGDVLDAPVSADAQQLAPNLWTQQVEAQLELERNWSAVRSWLGGALADHGVDRIAAEELTVPPGADELFSLLEVSRHAESGDWDVIVVDCAPTSETLRLLSFPEAASWWLDKIFGREQQLLAAARPLAQTLLDITLPSDEVFKEARRLVENLIAMDRLLHSENVSLRLVMTPDRMVVAEAMRTYTYLCLYGYLTDAVVVNRVFPDEVDGYFAAWRDVQRETLAEVQDGFAPVPVLRAPYFEREVIGAEMLDRLGEALFAEHTDAAAVLHDEIGQQLEVNGSSATLRVKLPFATKGEISLKKIGLDLVVGVDGRRRTIALPSSLAAYRPAGASFEDGALLIRFDA